MINTHIRPPAYFMINAVPRFSYVSTVIPLNFSLPCVAVLTDRPPPIIRQGPSNQTLGVDSVALLKCQASGDPIPSISWLKDGVSLLGKDPRMSLQELGSLQIKNIKVKDFRSEEQLQIWLIFKMEEARCNITP